MKLDNKEYDNLFGNIPNTQEGRIEYILGKKVNNKHLNDIIKVAARKLKRIGWNTIKFTMWKIVRPSARPRVNNRCGFPQMYVPRAAMNGDWFKKFYEGTELPYIETPCKISIVIYEKTPTSLNIRDKVLAEMGLIRPWKRSGDIDNYMKAILDMMQHGMLADDCLVIESSQKLFYSIKPRAEIEVKYMKSFPKV